MVIGWQLAGHLRTSLVTDALQMAIDAGHVAPDAIFHSDRGTQGGFKRSSQHPDQQGCDVGTNSSVDVDEDRPRADAVPRPAAAAA
jgi:hypothetical protein